MSISRTSLPSQLLTRPDNSATCANIRSSVIVRNIQNCAESPQVSVQSKTHTQVEFDAVKALLLLGAECQVEENLAAQAENQDAELRPLKLASIVTKEVLEQSNAHKLSQVEISSKSITKWSKAVPEKRLEIAKRKALAMKDFKNLTKIAREVQVHPMTVRKWFKQAGESLQPDFQALEQEAIVTLQQFQGNFETLAPRMKSSKVKELTVAELSSFNKLVDLPKAVKSKIKKCACDYIRMGMTHKDARIQTMRDFNVIISAVSVVSRWASSERLGGIRKEKIEKAKKYALTMKGTIPVNEIAANIALKPKSVRQWFRLNAKKIVKTSTAKTSNGSSQL